MKKILLLLLITFGSLFAPSKKKDHPKHTKTKKVHKTKSGIKKKRSKKKAHKKRVGIKLKRLRREIHLSINTNTTHNEISRTIKQIRLEKVNLEKAKKEIISNLFNNPSQYSSKNEYPILNQQNQTTTQRKITIIDCINACVLAENNDYLMPLYKKINARRRQNNS